MSIFTDDKERIENLNKSADALGGVKAKQTRRVMVSKKNCKHCWGGGLLGYQPVNGSYATIYCRCVTEKQIEIDS